MSVVVYNLRYIL